MLRFFDSQYALRGEFGICAWKGVHGVEYGSERNWDIYEGYSWDKSRGDVEAFCMMVFHLLLPSILIPDLSAIVSPSRL